MTRSILLFALTLTTAINTGDILIHGQNDPISTASETLKKKKTKSWTLYHRLITSKSNIVAAAVSTSKTTDTTSGGVDPINMDWSIRAIVKLTDISSLEDSTAITGKDGETVLLEILHNNETAITDSLLHDIRTLDAIPSNGTTTWYQLKLVPVIEDIKSHTTPNNTIISSVPACHVLRCNFRDEIVLHFQSPTRATVISMTYIPYISRFAPTTCTDYIPPLPITSLARNESSNNDTSLYPKYFFQTKMSYETSVPGMVVGRPTLIDPITQLPVGGITATIKPPPGYKWFNNALITSTASPKTAHSKGTTGKSDDDEEGQSTEPPPQEPPFSFFRKYWYIFVPLMMMNIMNAVNPPPQQGQQQGGTAAASIAGATAAAATTASGGQQRRGKKD